MNRNNWLIALIWVMVIVGVVASTVTLVAANTGMGRHFVTDREADMIERYARLDLIREKLESDYIDEVDPDTLMLGAIRGMMASLGDPYTFYYTPEELGAHNRELGSEYLGIGLLMQSTASGAIEVLRVYADSPAEKSGVRSGDYILKINGETVYAVNEQTLNAAAERIHGEMGETVELTLKRGSETIVVSVANEPVSIDNVTSTVIDGFGYINIYQFSGDDVEGFQKALEALLTADVQGLVIDVRNNPGGLLEDVKAIADMLLPEGCIVYMQDREGRRTDFYSDAEYCDLPLCVLVNGNSASASEIFAAAVQEFGRGTVVGTQTYGKGIVQNLLTFEPDKAGMQYTTQRYYTASGKCIHGIGVTPDVIVDADGEKPDANGIPDPENDVQLAKALALLAGE